MTFQLRRLDLFHKKLWKLNLEKNLYLKKYKNKYKSFQSDQSSV